MTHQQQEYKIMRFLGYRLADHPTVNCKMWDCESGTPLKDRLQGKLTIVRINFHTDWNLLMAAIKHIAEQPVFATGDPLWGHYLSQITTAITTGNIDLAYLTVFNAIDIYEKRK